jgi:hypothetical protein
MASNYRRQTIQQSVNRDDVLRQLDADSDSELSEIASDDSSDNDTDDDIHDVGGVVQGGAVQAGVGVQADDDPWNDNDEDNYISVWCPAYAQMPGVVLPPMPDEKHPEDYFSYNVI